VILPPLVFPGERLANPVVGKNDMGGGRGSWAKMTTKRGVKLTAPLFHLTKQ